MPTNSDNETVHALTIDVEGFAESHAESVPVDPELLHPARCDREIAANLEVTLELLSECGRHATFFFLGRIAQTAPHLVRRVADAGHEVGCHSLNHVRITGQTPGEFRSQITEAKARLEDASAQAVRGFRAPEFSIMETTRWAVDELAAAGFRYDSSVVPTGLQDTYGMAGVPGAIFRWPNGLVEFPLPVVRVLGIGLPMGGGGFFRLYPLALTQSLYRRRTRLGIPTAFYIHPYEIGPVAPRLPGLSRPRRFRHYIRLAHGRKRLEPLLREQPFDTMAAVLEKLGFLEAETHSGRSDE